MRRPAEHRVGRTEVDGDVGPRQMVVPDRIRLTDRLPPDTSLDLRFCGHACLAVLRESSGWPKTLSIAMRVRSSSSGQM